MNKLKNLNGFSLIEVLVSLVILAISLLALAGLMTTTTKNNSVGGHLTEAATLAQDKLEEFRAIKWSDVKLDSDSVPGSTGIIYKREWKIGPDPPNDNYKEITITISWNDSVDRSLSFISVLSNPGDD